MAKLSKEQIAKIKALLDEKGELPPEWRWELFPPEKQEYELVYAAKQREEDILSQTMAVPLQNVRTFNNGSGQPKDGEWYNRLIFGDNLQAMKSLINDPNVAGKVKLVYIDPPFATKQDFKGSRDQKAYQDKIAGAKFLEFLRSRLILLSELLSDNGCIYVHLDQRKGHYAKTLMDEIFGEQNFLNDISWCYKEREISKTHWNEKHDHILFYKKNGKPFFNWEAVTLPYSEGTIKKYTLIDENGKKYQIRGKGGPYIGKQQLSPEIEKKYPEYTYRDYLDKKPGILPRDWWADISFVNRAANERTSYPTQKPEALLERIITASSDTGDLVIDVFAGSGTTLAVAEKLGRRWIGMDCGKLAIYTIQKRMLNLRKEIGDKGKPLTAKPFVLQNAGLYDFESLKDLPWDDWRFFALQLFECRDKAHEIGGLKLDGEKGGAPVLVFDWKKNPGQTISEETIADIHGMVGKKIGKRFYIIAPMMAFDFFQDYIDVQGVRYYALRIPYSMIHELHRRDFQAVLQAREEGNVNDIQEAYGFSFMMAPDVEWEVSTSKSNCQASLKTKKFISHAIIKGDEREGGLQTLAMLMVDLNYDGKVFDMDKAFYGEELEKEDWTVSFSPEEVSEKIMVVWTDFHGNESKAVIGREEFGLLPIEKLKK